MIVKVCGMTEADNIRQVDVLGVNLIGFIFYPKSPRYLYQIPRYLPILAKRVGDMLCRKIVLIHRIRHKLVCYMSAVEQTGCIGAVWCCHIRILQVVSPV